jgi:hypothetical protein
MARYEIDGVHFLGNSLWGNHSFRNPTKNYFKGDDLLRTDLMSDFQAMMPTATVTGNFSGNFSINWESFSITVTNHEVWAYAGTGMVGGKFSNMPTTLRTDDADFTKKPSFTAVYNSNINSLSLFWYKDNVTYLIMVSEFAAINQTLGYYSQYPWTVMVKSAANSFSAYHFINSSNTPILSDSYSYYPIICSDGQTPQPTWVSDVIFQHDSQELGYPGIGKLPDYVGSPDLTHPLYIPHYISSVQKYYLPIGRWLGKTLFMRCYTDADNNP